LPETEYGTVSKLLHQLALAPRFLAEASFDIEQATQKPDAEAVFEEPHVFIAGLARAGTTLLMRRLHATGEFRSLTYRDMPFVLMPNLWLRLSSGSRKEAVPKERAHGDGLMVDYDSPEALEEVFWRVFAEKEYLHRDSLSPMDATDELTGKFQTYVADIVGSSGKRYLSKNNNNILRLSSLREAFPNAVLIVPFREPTQHADSLLNQHLKFRTEADPFVKKYMTWLAHHEFGADHRRFRFGETDPVFSDPEKLDYWLELWADTYEYLLEAAPKGTIFIGYERFCTDLPKVWHRLSKEANLEEHPEDADSVELRQREPEEHPDERQQARAASIYQSLQQLMAQWMG